MSERFLPPQRKKVYEFITAELRAGRPFPEPYQIALHMGWRNSGSAGDALGKLCATDKVLDRVGAAYQVRVG